MWRGSRRSSTLNGWKPCGPKWSAGGSSSATFKQTHRCRPSTTRRSGFCAFGWRGCTRSCASACRWPAATRRCPANYAAALSAHARAIKSLESASQPFPALSLAVHSFHVHTVVRFLPWLVRMRRDTGEVDEVVQRGEQSMRSAKAALSAGGAGVQGGGEERLATGLLAWLEGMLHLRCGGAAKEVLAVLQTGLRSSTTSGDSPCSVVRERLLVQMEAVLALLGAEESGLDDGEARALLEAQRAEVAGALQRTRRWRRTHPQQASAERALVYSGLWLLEANDVEDDSADDAHEASAASSSEEGGDDGAALEGPEPAEDEPVADADEGDGGSGSESSQPSSSDDADADCESVHAPRVRPFTSSAPGDAQP